VNEQREFLALVVSRLETAAMRYMLTGSVALACYAVPRMTRDIDLVIQCVPADARRIAALFGPDCYVDEAAVLQAIEGRAAFNAIHREWLAKADFIVQKRGAYWELQFSRRRQMDLEGLTVWAVAPEDLMLSKLWWAKDSGSELQLRDATAIASSVRGLDWEYVEEWADSLGVRRILEKVKPK
jgi:hypothetical protein